VEDHEGVDAHDGLIAAPSHHAPAPGRTVERERRRRQILQELSPDNVLRPARPHSFQRGAVRIRLDDQQQIVVDEGEIVRSNRSERFADAPDLERR
jgi:hypothetical protein